MTQTPPGPYLKDPLLDNTNRMLLEVLSELWILRDRFAVLEHLLEKKGTVSKDEIENFVPDAEFSARLEKLRKLMIENVIGAPYRDRENVGSLKEKGRRMAET